MDRKQQHWSVPFPGSLNKSGYIRFQQHLARPLLFVASSESIVQQQAVLSRPSMVLMTAAAQPTPDMTERASVGQLRLQAPHSIQASRFWISTRPTPFSLRTAWGHTCIHIPQAMHFPSFNCRVTTFLRYSNCAIP